MLSADANYRNVSLSLMDGRRCAGRRALSSRSCSGRSSAREINPPSWPLRISLLSELDDVALKFQGPADADDPTPHLSHDTHCIGRKPRAFMNVPVGAPVVLIGHLRGSRRTNEFGSSHPLAFCTARDAADYSRPGNSGEPLLFLLVVESSARLMGTDSRGLCSFHPPTGTVSTRTRREGRKRKKEGGERQETDCWRLDQLGSRTRFPVLFFPVPGLAPISAALLLRLRFRRVVASLFPWGQSVN